MTLSAYAVSPNPSIDERKDLHVLFAGESQTKPNHKLGPKLYDHYLLHHVIDGYGTFITESRTYSLGPGDAFLITPSQLVSYVSDSNKPWSYRWAAFKGNEAEALIRRAGFTQDENVVHTADAHIPEQALQRMYESFMNREPACDLIACGSLYLVMAHYANHHQDSKTTATTALKPENETQHIVRQMIHMMNNQYAHPFTMEQMADNLGYSRAYLSRLFKQVTDVSPVTFLLKLRIDKGRQLLRERPDLSVEQISSSVGLTDPLYFSRQFRRFYQQSPTQYRDAIRSPQ